MYATIIFLIFLCIAVVTVVLALLFIRLFDVLMVAENWVGIVAIAGVVVIGFFICLLIDLVL